MGKMNIQGIERRHQAPPGPANLHSTAVTIRESLLVQRQTGTVSAIEYLKSNGVSAAVIERVLSGSATRFDDR
jgi:hypothetical protein